MRDDLDAGKIGEMLGLQDGGDLGKPVAASVDDEGLLARLQSVQEILNIGHIGIDEDDIVNVRRAIRADRRVGARPAMRGRRRMHRIGFRQSRLP
jgi:hypothetical protein